VDEGIHKTVTFHLPEPPSVNALFANVPGRGRRKTKVYRQWIKDAGWALVAQRPKKLVGNYRLRLSFCRTFKIRKDLGNFEKAVSDLLVRHHVVTDDSCSDSILLDWQGTQPGVVEITLSQGGDHVSRTES
jgi:Holliday junction resolvase RusA-like endonuclease